MKIICFVFVVLAALVLRTTQQENCMNMDTVTKMVNNTKDCWKDSDVMDADAMTGGMNCYYFNLGLCDDKGMVNDGDEFAKNFSYLLEPKFAKQYVAGIVKKCWTEPCPVLNMTDCLSAELTTKCEEMYPPQVVEPQNVETQDAVPQDVESK